MKKKSYVFVTNENKEIVRFCGQVKKKYWFPRKNTLPFLFWHDHLVKEVWLLERAVAVHAGVFGKLSALEDLYIPSAGITLAEGCLPDHKVTLHVPYDDAVCGEVLRGYDWNADHKDATGFASILWLVQTGKARLRLTVSGDCGDLPQIAPPYSADITIEHSGKTR